MKILSLYTPLVRTTRLINTSHTLKPAFLVKCYHSADYSGGGIMGRDNFTHPLPTPPTKGPEDPFAHLELAQITDPRAVRKHPSCLPCRYSSLSFRL